MKIDFDNLPTPPKELSLPLSDTVTVDQLQDFLDDCRLAMVTHLIVWTYQDDGGFTEMFMEPYE